MSMPAGLPDARIPTGIEKFARLAPETSSGSRAKHLIREPGSTTCERGIMIRVWGGLSVKILWPGLLRSPLPGIVSRTYYPIQFALKTRLGSHQLKHLSLQAQYRAL